ncbi:MAG TPA: PD-(D/E)XK nuclease family protein [Gemmatimonadota bacterium]|nr:PD-(D/E)XK nuclease family protein [Gemmatimonadota bacterium]
MLTVVPSRRVAAQLADASMEEWGENGAVIGSRATWTADIVTLPELLDRILAAHPEPRDRLSDLAAAYLLDDIVEGLEPEVLRLFGPGAEGPGASRAIGAAIREIRGAGLRAADLVAAVAGNRRLQALAATLDAFERRLEAIGHWDEADALRAATAMARAGAWPEAKLDAFEVTGLYDVSPLHGELLTAIALRAERVRVRIPFHPDDPDATSYAFPYVHLWERLDDPALDIEIVYPDREDAPRRIRFAAPNHPTDEARLAADWARARIDAGARPEEISIVLAGGAANARRVARELSRRGVAYHARRGALLTETPTLAATLLPFRLIEEGFRRAEVEAWIASPLTGRLDAAVLLPHVRRGPASGGPSAEWGRAIREVRDESAKALNLALQRVESLGRAERAPAAFWPAYAEALFAAGIEQTEGAPGWEPWLAALRDLRSGLEAVGRWDGPPMAWRYHRRRLLDAISNRRERLGRPGRGVALLTPRDGRALRFRHTAVIGLSRGSLLGRDAAAQVLGDRERRALNDVAGERVFRLSAETMREGTLLVAERRRETAEELLLSCPLENDDSTPLLPAIEFEATRRRFRPTSIDESTPVEATAWRLGRGADAVARLQTIERDRALFLSREENTRRGQGGAHGGAFRERRALALLALVPDGRLGRWSASQLESWRQCPHQFFQRYLLGLKRPDESPVEAEASAVGILVHRALNVLYEEGLGALPPDRARIEAILAAAEDAVDVALRGDPAVWAATRRRTAAELVAYLRYVAAKHPTGPSDRPRAFELGFGLDKDGPPAVGIETIHGRVELRGRLDRLDRDAASGALHVLDYKHSKKRKSHQDAVDENVCGIDRFQLYAYFLAAAEWAARAGFDAPPALTGAIHCIREPRVLGSLVAPPSDEIRQRIAAAIEDALAGRYDPSPRDRDVCGYCDFRRSCRIALVAPGDPGSVEPEEEA